MIMRDDELSNILQQQDEYEAYKLMDKEQRSMKSTTTDKALLLF